MATIKKRLNAKGIARYTAEVRKTDPHSGRLIKASATFGSERAAKAWILTTEADIERGVWRDPREAAREDASRTLTLHEALTRYKEEVTIHRPRGLHELRRVQWWQKHPLAQRPLQALTRHDFNEHRDARVKDGLASSTIRNELNLISALYRHARKEWRGFETLENPLTGMRRTRPEGMPPGRNRTLQYVESKGKSEEELILEAADTPLKQMFILAVETAMRQNELLSLKWEWIGSDDIIRLPHSITKTKLNRAIPLSNKAKKALEDIGWKKAGQVFTWTKDQLDYRWNQLKDRLEIEDLHWHDLRHEATTRLFEVKKLQIQEVRLITGHETLEMLLRYTHIDVRSIADRVR